MTVQLDKFFNVMIEAINDNLDNNALERFINIIQGRSDFTYAGGGYNSNKQFLVFIVDCLLSMLS